MKTNPLGSLGLGAGPGRVLFALCWPCAAAGAWLWVWAYLADEWTANSNYEFGWIVPPLLVLLAYRRWPGPVAPPVGPLCAGLLLALAAGVWAAGEFVRQIDPLWRMTGGLLAAGATLFATAWLLRTGGPPRWRRQLGPLVFAWTALPWPMPVENTVVRHLAEFVAGATVSIATACGLPAMQRGNAIELVGGAVGIEDACSGLQSLQAALMAAVFLGEFHRLTVTRRVLLAVAGGGLAAAGNLARIGTLVLLASRGGKQMATAFHDTVGLTASLGIFAAILGAALLLRRPPLGTGASRPDPHPTLPPPSRRAPDGPLALAIVVLIPTAIALWLQPIAPLPTAPRGPSWRLDVGGLPAAWAAAPFEPGRRERSMLGFTSHAAWRVRPPDGPTAAVYHLYWRGRKGMPPMAFYHTPGMCMPWQGWQPVAAPAKIEVRIGGRPLPAVLYRMRLDTAELAAVQILVAGGQPVYFMIDPATIGGRLARLATAWRLPRDKVDEEILIYLQLETPAQSPSAAAQTLLDHLFRATAGTTVDPDPAGN